MKVLRPSNLGHLTVAALEPPVDPRARPRALPRKANALKMTMAQAAEALDRNRAGESQRALR
jgi:hypothetical protein